jgi:Tol biopolymer transport system component
MEVIVNFPCWSLDGKWIAFSAQPEGHSDVYVVAASGGIPTRLTDAPSDDRGPEWSPDSEWIYFGSNRGGNRALWKVPLGGGTAVEAEPNELGRSADGWKLGESTDGEWTYWKEEGGVWKESVQSGKRIPVPEVIGEDPVLVKNRIYSVKSNYSSSFFSIHMYDLEAGEAKELAVVDREYGGSLAVSPDGRSILYVQNDQVGSDIMLVENFR